MVWVQQLFLMMAKGVPAANVVAATHKGVSREGDSLSTTPYEGLRCRQQSLIVGAWDPPFPSFPKHTT